MATDTKTNLPAGDDALRESEAKLRAIYEILPAGISIIDMNRQFVDMNPALGKILGISKEGLLNGEFNGWRFIHPDGSTMQQNEFASSLALEKGCPVYNVETGVIKPDGETVWTSVSASPLPGGTGVVISTVDITEQKRFEEALYHSEETYRLLFENNLTAVLYSDPQGGIFKANSVACEMFGYTEEEFHALGRHGVIDITDPGVPAALEERKKTGKFTGILHFRKKDGTVFPVEAYSKIFRLKDGAVRTINVLRDITEQLSAEEKLKSSYDRLHDLAVQMQTIREEERSAIARDIHDDMGGILTALKIELSLIDKENRKAGDSIDRDYLSSEINEMQEMIAGAMNNMYKLIKELRPEVIKNFGLLRSLELLVLEFEKRTRILTSFNKNIDSLRADHNKSLAIYRILQESLTNIAKHSEATEVNVSVIKGNGKLELEIRDNGKGFDFDNNGGKTSLGLIGMKERVLILGGELAVNSQKGIGTTLKISVPFE